MRVPPTLDLLFPDLTSVLAHKHPPLADVWRAAVLPSRQQNASSTRNRDHDQPRICRAGIGHRPPAPARALTSAHRMSRDRAAPATTHRGCRLRARSQRPAAADQANAAQGPPTLGAANRIRWPVRLLETDIPQPRNADCAYSRISRNRIRDPG